MKLRPTIFLSGVSSEFGSFRDAVEVEVQKKGCFAENQSSFGVDYHTVEEMLRRRISDADAVIHIVGFRFGAEPRDRPADKPRRSYTQMEYDIARELEKPIYVFLSSDVAIGDAQRTDDAEATALQLTYRQTVQNTNSLFYFFNDKAALCKLAGEIDAVAQADFRVDISRIDKYAPAELIGREDELALLNDAWLKVRRAEPKRPHILTFVALGGEGKTSLIAKWLANLAFQNWPGCDSAFAWSFYSQGTHEQSVASSDLFLKEAISFFGNDTDKELAASNADAYEKGQRLAGILRQRRALLILDGLEPLQYAPTSTMAGELKDSGIAVLLKMLAADAEGLCIVTTRYSLPNLKTYWQTTAPEVPVHHLSLEAGVQLLKTLGVKGSAKEFKILIEDVRGHALTLSLLGTYLRDAHAGDIRRRNFVKLGEADAEEQGGHAFRVIEAYEATLEGESEKGRRAVAILRLLGLFDRPGSADCLASLLKEPAIIGLTEQLVGLSETQFNLALRRLEDAKLLTINRDASNSLASIDAHPLLREYFARQLSTKHPDGWRDAHRRLYEHLSATTTDKIQPTLEDLQPLYQAVIHGCQARLPEEACRGIYYDRIQRGPEHYSPRKLGAFSSDLGAIACFFEVLWSQLLPGLSEVAQAWLLNEAATRLRALGRLTEALEPMRVSGIIDAKAKRWDGAAISYSNLSELELTLGKIPEAVQDAMQAITYADLSGDIVERINTCTTYADVLHQLGKLDEAETHFQQAEQMQSKRDPPILISVLGFRYCDLLLSLLERRAWHRVLKSHDCLEFLGKSSNEGTPDKPIGEHEPGRFPSPPNKKLMFVFQRAEQMLTLEREMQGAPLLDFALHQLMLGRTALYEAILCETGSITEGELTPVKNNVAGAVHDLRRAGTLHYLPQGLLTRSWLRFLMGVLTGSESAQDDLDEAWEVVERGPMRLFMADIHLYRARLFFREKEYPWESPEADLKAARKLIEQCGYWRRKEELEDAEQVILK